MATTSGFDDRALNGCPNTNECSGREEPSRHEREDKNGLGKSISIPSGSSPAPSKAALEKALQALEEKDPESLPEVPRPRPPTNFAPAASAAWRVDRIQQYISRLEYNHTGTNYFAIRKDRGAKRLAGTAREIMRESLPIKCIEAVFLGFYLTLGMTDLVRIPLRFQSSVEQNGRFVFKHIVMAVGHKGRWGAIGLSRKKTLMHRKIQFDSLAALIEDFCDAYGDLGHSVQHVGVGLPFGHCEHSMEPIHWRPLMIEFNGAGRTWTAATSEAVNAFVAKMDVIEAYVVAHGGELPAWFLDQHPSVKGGAKSGTAASNAKRGGRRKSGASGKAGKDDASKGADEENLDEDDEVQEDDDEEEEEEEEEKEDEDGEADDAAAAAEDESKNKTSHMFLNMTSEEFLAAREPAPPSLEVLALGLGAVSIPTLESLSL